MSLDALVDSSQLDADLTSVANAIRTRGGTSASLAFPSGFVSAIGAIPGGGAAITDGIVIKTRDANGYATEVDFYGTTVQPQQFYNRVATDGPWKNLQTINFKDSITTIANNAFYYCQNLVFTAGQLDTVTTIKSCGLQNNGSTSLSLPSLTTIEAMAFIGMPYLTTISLPKLTNCNFNGFLRGCTALQTVQLGSVGYAVTAVNNQAFYQDTQSGLTITVYTTGGNADAIVTNIRASATNATIVIKAAEATTYGGTNYAAGATILTSEVT